MMDEIDFDLSQAQELPDEVYSLIWEVTFNGICIDTVNDYPYPLPWDAGVSIKGEDLVLSGGAGESGFGSCVVKIPKEDQPKIYRIYMEPKCGKMNELIACLAEMKKFGWKII